jgi:hypothetical protein
MTTTTPPRRWFRPVAAAIAGILVGAALLATVLTTASPAQLRAERLDDLRSRNLSAYRNAAADHYRQTGTVPEKDSDLPPADWQSDPVTGRRYEYRAVDQHRFELCAEFSAPANEAAGDSAVRPDPGALSSEDEPNFYQHPAGRHCWTVNVIRLNLTPCDLNRPCQIGYTCAYLPKTELTRCLPDDRLCEVAGCAEDCRVADGHPARISCAAAPEQPTAAECALMRGPTGDVGCFGCAGGICDDPPNGWAPFVPDDFGVPYACFSGPAGCELAQ